MNRYRNRLLAIRVVMTAATCTLASSTLAWDRAPEVVNEKRAVAAQEAITGALSDPAAPVDANFIKGCTVVPSGVGISPVAAAAASIVAFRDEGRGNDFAGDLSGGSGRFLLHVRRILEKHIGPGKKKEVDGAMKRLPEAIWLAYNEDAVRCVKRRHPNASLPWYYHGPIPAEWCAELVQEYFEQAQGLTRQDRVKHALLSYAKQRELFVTISIEKGSQERCRESIIRKMPFLCFFGTPDNPRVYAACGYAQMDGRFYLLALDSEKYRPNYATASKIWSPNDTTPGLVVLDADPGTCTCMFIYNWCHDEKALEERIVRFLAEHKDAKEKPAKPLPEGPTTQEPAR